MSVGPTPDIRIVAVHTDADRKRWRPGFIGAYQTVFSGAPYFERFSPSEAEGVWVRLTRAPGNTTLIALDPQDKLVGFGIGLPLVEQRDIAHRLDGLVSAPHTYYLAELGVLPDYRGRGVGHRLVRGRLEAIDRTRFRDVVLRAPSVRSGDYPLYTPLGFAETGETMDVRNMRVDGRVTSDRRVFLHCVLSQIRLDARPVTR
jgi:ribosomal protein S18 acetylase RimI-like enzyme